MKLERLIDILEALSDCVGKDAEVLLSTQNINEGDILGEEWQVSGVEINDNGVIIVSRETV